MDVQPWTEKYRPRSISDISSQEDVVSVLSNTAASQNMPHLLLYGPPGTGKTTTILALAHQMYKGPEGIKGKVLELNASDERGIDIVRDKIKTFAKIAVGSGAGPAFKIIILDEADSMTPDAQAALRRIMETYSRVTRFCLICNYVSRIIDPLASRCAKLRFKPIPLPQITHRLQHICEMEEMQVEAGVIEMLAHVCGGDLRRAITLLQSVKRTCADTGVTANIVSEMAGVIPDAVMRSIVDTWLAGDVQGLETQVDAMVRMGYSGMQFLAQFADMVHETAHTSEQDKCRVAVLLGRADKAMTDGADEHLQVLNVLVQSVA